MKRVAIASALIAAASPVVAMTPTERETYEKIVMQLQSQVSDLATHRNKRHVLMYINYVNQTVKQKQPTWRVFLRGKFICVRTGYSKGWTNIELK